MTFVEFIDIFRARMGLSFAIIGLVLAGAIVGYQLQAPHYTANFYLSVTRTGKDVTADYRYHEFYRLQADERFADTVMQYLLTPQAKNQIEKRATLTPSEAGYFLNQSLFVKRLSSNFLSVSAPVKSVASGEAVATALPAIVNLYASDLNHDADEPDWFEVQATAPEIIDARLSFAHALWGGLLLGLFLAFWIDLGVYFWTGRKKPSDEDWD